MKKILLVLSICILPTFAEAQVADSHYEIESLKKRVAEMEIKNIAAANELVSFQRSYYTGIAMQFVGAALIGVGAIAEKEIAYYAGGAIILSGTVTIIISHRHIGLAGKAMKRYQ